MSHTPPRSLVFPPSHLLRKLSSRRHSVGNFVLSQLFSSILLCSPGIPVVYTSRVLRGQQGSTSQRVQVRDALRHNVVGFADTFFLPYHRVDRVDLHERIADEPTRYPHSTVSDFICVLQTPAFSLLARNYPNVNRNLNLSST